MTGWRTDPWEPAFLSGLVRRLADYLGSPPPKLPSGYAAYVLAWPDVPGDAAVRLAAAGLSAAVPAHPGDALLCRWLSDPGRRQVPGAVVAVAVGERHTTVTRYELAWSSSGRPRQVQRGRTETVAEGCGPWAEALARDLLRRMAELPQPEVILPFLDAVRELSGVGGERLPWTGPLAERLRSYRVSWRTGEVADKARPGVEAVTAMVSDLAVVGSQVVLGGPGATWPLLPEALQKQAIVWRSPDPLSDLARGAARWADYRVLLPPV